jgi:hypothetical protein
MSISAMTAPFLSIVTASFLGMSLSGDTGAQRPANAHGFDRRADLRLFVDCVLVHVAQRLPRLPVSPRGQLLRRQSRATTTRRESPRSD